MSKDDFRRMKEQLSPSEKAVSELYEKIEQEKENQNSKLKTYKKIIKYTSVAACFVLMLAGAGVALNISGNNSQNTPLVSKAETGKNSTTETSLPKQNTEDYIDDDYYITEESQSNETNDISGEINSGDVYLNTEFEFNGNKYIIAEKTSGYSYGTNLSAESVQLKSTSSDESIYVNVYEWNNVQSETAVIAGKQYTGESDVEMLEPCYICINKEYNAKTLGDFITDFNIDNNVNFKSIRYELYDDMVASCSTYYVNAGDTELYNMLFADLSAPNAGEDDRIFESPLDVMNLYINADGLEICASLDESGYLTVKISSVSNRFYIGADKAQEIFDYAQTKYSKNTNNSVSDSETSYEEFYGGEPVWDEELGEYIILE